VNVNVEPCPIWLLTQIRPPCNSMNSRERASPSPVPSTFLSAVPTWRNSSKAFEAISRSGAAAALRMVDPTGGPLRARTLELAVRHRLPVMFAFREDVEAGGLVAYGASISAQYQQAATFVHKILRGARPGDLPIEQASKFEFVLNLKTAKAIGLTIPPSLLLRADQVIE
jgi:putative tryptophan/tyrosine transport system substrate-binding protein